MSGTRANSSLTAFFTTSTGLYVLLAIVIVIAAVVLIHRYEAKQNTATVGVVSIDRQTKRNGNTTEVVAEHVHKHKHKKKSTE